uniref:AF4/FMR2 C-terminal homology domain-containing protein n=1 Tax=Neogobius melanostomus TaxID=47308 RepID=A0A8C6WEB1_9GOBI
MPSGDWQLDKWVNFSQQNYRRKSQWAAPRSPKLSLLKDELKPSSVSVFSPDRDTSNLPSLIQKTVNFPTAQLSSTQENHEHQSSPQSCSTSNPLGSPLPTDPVNHVLENRNGGVGVNSDLTLSREQEPGLGESPKVKSHPKQSKNGSVVFESEVTTNHNKNRYKNIKSDHCAACANSNNSSQSTYSDHITPACCCGKSKGEAKHKRFANLSQKDKHLHGCSQDSSKGTPSLVVKIDLNLLSKISRTLKSPEIKLCTKDYKQRRVTNSRQNDKGDQYCPKKKLKLQGHNQSLHTARLENSNPTEATEKRSIKKDEIPLTPSAVRDCSQKSKKPKLFNGNAHPSLNKEEVKCPIDPKKNAGKTMEESTATKLFSDSHRPLLRFEDRHYPVKHYIKEAKRLKHKADTEMDKLTKVFHYLDGALFFIESGIAMEKDPQISMSSYTMFAETVELIKFVLNLTNSEELSPTESDIIALCLKCQALLQMAMFHTKERAAISYSKTLTDHFNSSSPSPPPFFGKRKTSWSPANPLSCSGPALCGSAAGFKGAPSGSVGVPQNIGQVALTYVNITTLFLSAHDLWDQAEEFTSKGNGLLTELNKVMGALSLTSTMSSMVCYIRQGLHWLQMDCIKND